MTSAIDLAVLGLLHDQDLHGYELKKQLGELLGPWSSVSFGSLYPALARLERRGAVRAVAEEGGDPMIPMTGALTGELAAFRGRRGAATRRGRRGKKVYGITDDGRSLLHELLRGDTDESDRTFALRVAFCQVLPVDERLVLFERRRAELQRQLEARGRGRGADDRRSDPYRRSLRDRDTRTLRHDLAWIDELVAATQIGTTAPDLATDVAGPHGGIPT